MSISDFIQRTKTKALSFAEARREAIASERKKQLAEYQIKNASLKAEASEREKLRKLKEDNRKLRMQRLTSKFPNFGGGSPGKKVDTGFKSPFSGGLGGNSPFKPDNLKKDSFGGTSPFSNAFAGNEPKKKVKKASRGKTIIIKV